MTPRFIAQQLSRPTGLLGRLTGSLMNRRNAPMNAFAVQQLDVGSADRVLEIGFGGGAALKSLLSTASFVAGVDRSRDTVELAKSRFSKAAAAGRAEFRVGVAEALPYGAEYFAKVCTVNTIYFWTSLDAGFAEIHRVLEPGGIAAIGFLPKKWMDRLGMPVDIFTSRAPEEVVAAMRRTGFKAVRAARPAHGTAWNVMVAVR